MNETKWTPGPWITQPCSAGGRLVIRGQYGQHQQSHVQIVPAEDACLIAAAPELYAMTDRLLSILVGNIVLQYGLDKAKEFLSREYPVVQEAMDLLAKARGEL